MWIILGVAVLLLLASLVVNIRNRINLKKSEKQIASLKADSSKFAQELLNQKKEFDSIVVPIEGPTEIEWRKEDVQVISRNAFVDDNIIRVNIKRLRQKLNDDKQEYIATVFGMGYTFGE